MTSIPAAANAGDVIDARYQVARLIGRGATADVFEALDQAQGGLPVALKILRASIARDPDAVARFGREAAAQRLVRHPNVAALFGAGVHAGAPYLAMELLAGRSVARVLHAEGRVAPARAVRWIAQSCLALATAHAAGVLHRDIKPGNLMLVDTGGRERMVVIDFGFAALEGARGLTQQGTVVGSLSYLAPERLRSEPASEQSDLYGLAVVLWEALVGHRPFAAADDGALIAAILDEVPMAPSHAAPDAGISPRVDAVVLGALAKDPAVRPPSAVAMARALEEALV